jgi:tight adherence protein B
VPAVLTPIVPLVLALALVCWPDRPARARILPPRNRVRLRAVVRQPRLVVTAVVAGCIGLVIAGPAGFVAAAAAAGTAVGRWRARQREARSIAATAELAAVLGLLAAELRAGAHPAAAAERVAADAGPTAAAVMSSVAATARLCGDVAAALRRQAAATPVLEQPLDQLAAAWMLAARHGIPLADVLDAVRGDLDHRVRARRRLHASLAGPRATAAVLACLPVLGLLLGQAIGAQPVRVLTGEGSGQLLLMLGVLLTCVGLAWSARLVARAAAP